MLLFDSILDVNQIQHAALAANKSKRSIIIHLAVNFKDILYANVAVGQIPETDLCKIVDFHLLLDDFDFAGISVAFLHHSDDPSRWQMWLTKQCNFFLLLFSKFLTNNHFLYLGIVFFRRHLICSLLMMYFE